MLNITYLAEETEPTEEEIKILDAFENGEPDYAPDTSIEDLKNELGLDLNNLISVTEKIEIIDKEYNIPVDNDIQEGVNSMCNLGQGIEERAIENVIM